MATQGRSPAIDSTGHVRGFRSRPGAPQAENDTLAGAGIAGAVGTTEHANAWNQYFHPKTQAAMEQLAPVTSGGSTPIVAPADNTMGADEANTLTNPSVPITPAQNVSASIAHNSAYLGSHGVAFPPPPRSADTSMPPAPWMPQGPGVPFVMPKMTGTYDEMLAQNKSIAAPGGAQRFFQQPKAYPQGWQGPAVPTQAGDYKSIYGTASVYPDGVAPPMTAKNPWGKPLPI